MPVKRSFWILSLVFLLSSPAVAEEASDPDPDPAATDSENPATPTEDVAAEEIAATVETLAQEEASAPAANPAPELALAPETDPLIDLHAKLPSWLEFDAEYRARSVYINPLELNGTQVRSMNWTEHRMRVGLGLKHGNWLAIRTRFDILDGVLWGDNGQYFQDPSPNSGVAIASRQPNSTRISVGLPEGADPLNPQSYVPKLEAAEYLQFDHVYADVILPFGLLRVGRQPANYGAGISGHDGGRHNRWGASSYGDLADRFLFGTKIDEAVRMIRGQRGAVNASMDDGVVLATWMDIYNTGTLNVSGDSLRQNGLMLQLGLSEANWGGLDWHGMKLSAAMVRMAGDNFDTGIWAFPVTLAGSIGDFSLQSYFTYQMGETREIAEGMAALTPRPPTIQEMAAWGARVVADYKVGPATFTLEFNVASGDDDPRHETPITSFSFPRDLNVGLLLFERIIAFESARRAAVGVENLAGLDAPSFPVTETSTEGRFTNAMALFPQVYVEAFRNPQHLLHARAGVLMAWPQAAGGAVEPIMSTLMHDGIEISDDTVNYHGGKPGNYYGTEFDLQLGWTFRQNFVWTVEAAFLRPGNSLQDINGDAVNSFMLENRFEFIF